MLYASGSVTPQQVKVERLEVEEKPEAGLPLSFGSALRSEQIGPELTAEGLRVEDSGQALLTLDWYPTSPANYAQGQRCSLETLETPKLDLLTPNPISLSG